MRLGMICPLVALSALSCLPQNAAARPNEPTRPSGLEPTGTWTQASTGSAPTPPMGWNSWNAFKLDISEDRILGSARAMVDTGLAHAGYRYVNINDGWWLKRRASDGRMLVKTKLFPSARIDGADQTSLRPLTDKLHAMGLKAGIYSDLGRNTCSQAWSPDNPNLPQGNQAEREVGLHGHVKQDIRLYFHDWNFDYIKVDACGLSAFGTNRPQVANGQFRAFGPQIIDANFNQSDIPAVKAMYAQVRNALRAVRPAGDYVLSLCNWGSANVRAWGDEIGTMWRTSNDIGPTWGHLLHNLDSAATRELYAGPGHWNDPDMLEVGNGAFDASHLVEARAQMSLWSIIAAPLIIGTDLTHAPQAIIDTLGAPEVVAVDQDPAGNQGVIAYVDSEREIIVKSLAARGEKAVVLFNRTNEPTDMTLTAAHLKMAARTPIALRNLWAREDIGSFTGEKAFHLGPHEAILLKATGRPLLPSGFYLSEMPARMHVAEDGIRALEADPIIHRMIDPYNPSTTSDGNRPSYAGWGAPRADATPFDESLRIDNVQYRYGLGVLANSRLQVKLDGKLRHFSAMVGVDDSTRGKRASVRFEVYGDGRRLAKSGAMRFNQPAAPLKADVKGVHVLELVVRQSGPDSGSIVTTWGDARVE